MGTGWIWTAQQLTLPTFALGALLLGAVAFIRVLPQLKRVQMESDNSLRADLMARVGVLESRVTTLEKDLAIERAHRADVEHDLVNERSSFDNFLILAESNPDRIFAMLPEIKEDRRRHRERMALKRGAREGTIIKGAGE